MLGNEIYPVDDTMMHQTVDLVDDRGEQSTYNVIDHLYFVPKVKENHYLHLTVRNIDVFQCFTANEMYQLNYIITGKPRWSTVTLCLLPRSLRLS